MRNLVENQFIESLAGHLPRSPRQQNKLFCSDAEIIRLGESWIALTTDVISEEIEAGLYSSPELMGWMTVVANLSDLAAVGARADGLLLHLVLPRNGKKDFAKLVMCGIEKACKAHDICILGGDTNFGSQTVLGATAIGVIEDGRIISRRGWSPDDQVYCTKLFGDGNAFAHSKLVQAFGNPFTYEPMADLKKGEIIREFGSTCIDTSDGFISAIAQLFEVNDSGIELSTDVDALLTSEVLAYAEKQNAPPWFFLAGPHGEFNLIFTIPDSNDEDFLRSAARQKWQPIHIGKVVAKRGLQMLKRNEIVPVDVFGIANLLINSDGDIKDYIEKLGQIEFYAVN